MSGLLTIAPHALAQNADRSSQPIAPSQLTPQTFVPPRAPGARVFEISAAAGLTAPAGAELFSLLVGRVELEGGFPELAAANDALAAKLSGKRVTIADIFAGAAELERAYADAGYALVRLTAPPQKLVDGGAVRIVVLDGFIEAVKVDGTPARVRDAVAARVDVLVGRKRLKATEIERAVLLAGDFSGLRLRSALSRGQQTGGSVLVIEGDHRLVTGAVTADNRLPAGLGGRQGTGSVSINSPLGLGEQFYASAGTSIGDRLTGFPLNAPMRVLGVGAVAPLTADGFTVNPEYTYSRAKNARTARTPETRGDFSRYTLRLSQPIVRERARTLIATATAEYVVQKMVAPEFATQLSSDRYRVLRVDLDWQARTSWEAPYRINMQFSKGMGGRNGADAVWSEIPLTRQGASPWFSRLVVRGWLSQALPSETQLNVIGMAQTSFGAPLFLSEQFALEGTEAVTGLPPGMVTLDTGATLRGELARAMVFASADDGPLTLSPYVFTAGGFGRVHQATAVERASLRAGSFGVGVRANITGKDGFQNLMLGIELGQQYSNIPGRTEGRRLNVYGGVRF